MSKSSYSSSSSASKEFLENMDKMIADANREMRKLFRSSRKLQLLNRTGVVLLVDDMVFQKTFIESLVKKYNLGLKVENVESAEEARRFISKQPDDIRLIIVDIMLLGSAALPNGVMTEDGLSLVEWIKEHHNIPFVITTGNVAKAEEASSRFPGVDVLLKGQTGIEDYADALGFLDIVQEESGEVIPKD